MDRGTNIGDIDGLMLLDSIPHGVQPLGVMHDLFRDQQLAVNEAAELAEDFLNTLAQFR